MVENNSKITNAASDTPPLVVSIILNWNNYEDTSKCISNLLQISYCPHKIVLVDNASSDDSFDKLQDEFPDIEHIQNEKNLGFSAGMNVGIKKAINNNAEYVWILNNDTVVNDPTTLNKLVWHLRNRSDLGAVTPVVDNHPKSDMPWFQQGIVNWKSGHSEHHQKIAAPSRQDGDILHNDFVPFCSTLIRCSVFDLVGLLPESYFMYREDVEFCGRMLEAGYCIGTDLKSSIEHAGAQNSGGEFSPTPTYYTARNRWLLRRRMSEQTEWLPFITDYIQWSLFIAVAVLWNLKFESLWAWVQGTIDGISGKSGKGPYP